MKIVRIVTPVMKASVNIRRPWVRPVIGSHHGIAVVVYMYIFTVVNINIYVIITVVGAIINIGSIIIGAYIIGFIARIAYAVCSVSAIIVVYS